MQVNVFDQQSALQIHSGDVEQIVKLALREEGQNCDEVNIHFVDLPTICDMHARYFNDPSPTDCISFPMDQEDKATPYHILGEVFVCPAAAVDYAKLNKKDPYEETTLYIIHGLLHLMGYDDLEETQCQQMRQAEARHIAKLKREGLILRDRTRIT